MFLFINDFHRIFLNAQNQKGTNRFEMQPDQALTCYDVDAHVEINIIFEFSVDEHASE